jgi:hypothetical protein
VNSKWKLLHHIVLMFLLLCFSNSLSFQWPATGFFNFPVVYAQVPPIRVEQTATVDYTPSGPQVTYETRIVNEGDRILSGILITDVLPPQATLLYFSNLEGTNWLSTQKEVNQRHLLLWLNQEPFAPGSVARLTYVVQIPPSSSGTMEIKKDLPIARADELGELSYPGQVSVLIDQSPRPRSIETNEPLLLSTPAPFPTPTPKPTDTPMPAASPPAVADSPETSPTVVLAQPSPTLAPTWTPLPIPVPEAAGQTFLVIPVLGVIVVVSATVIWLLSKKKR